MLLHIRCSDVQILAHARLAEHLLEGLGIRVGVFEFGEEGDGVGGVGCFWISRFETVMGHEGDTTGLFGKYDVKDALGGGVVVDYDVEKTVAAH